MQEARARRLGSRCCSTRWHRARRPGIELLEHRNLLTTVTLVSDQDTTLFEDNSGALANGGGEFFFVGTTDPRNNNVVRRGLIQFDLTNQIPADAIINRVSLTLNMSRTIADDEPISLHLVLKSWGEGASDAPAREGRGTVPTPGDATWVHRRFPTETWDSAGGDFKESPSAVIDVGAVGRYTWTDPDMVQDVQHWLENPTQNFGWILVSDEVANTTAKRFDSRENSVEANRPSLTIDFTSLTPALDIGDATVIEGDFGTRTLHFPITLTQEPAQDATILVTSSDGTATAGSDYQQVNGAITFTEDGPLSQDVTVLVIGDTLTEADETLTMSVTTTDDVVILDGEAVGTITNDDPEPEITIADASTEEGDTGLLTAEWAVELSHASAFEVAVDYATASGTAEEGVDFSTATGRLTFPPGQTSQRIDVSIIGDTQDEEDETFTVQLSNATNAQLTDAAASMKIVDNDAGVMLPSLSVSDAVVLEGARGLTAIGFAVTLSEAPNAEVNVQFAATAGSATEGTDYEGISGTLTFAPNGPLTQNISVNVMGDRVTETDETFTLVLSNPSGAVIQDGEAVGTITNDDPEPDVTITNRSITEGDSGASFVSLTVQLSHPTVFAVTVDYATQAGTAGAGDDFTTRSGQLNFPPGVTFQTVDVSVNGDVLVEPDETFSVRLSSALNARLTVNNAATVTIVNDDEEIVEFPWHNTVLPEDVTGDGLVVPLDALRVINWLNSVGSGPLAAPTPTNEPPPFLDVNGDDQVSPIDALRVINLLNKQSPLPVLAVASSSSLTAPNVDAALADLAAASLGLDDDTQITNSN